MASIIASWVFEKMWLQADETLHEIEVPRRTDGDSVVSRLGRSTAELSRTVLQGAASGQESATVTVSL